MRNTTPKRKSAEYRAFLENVIEDYNSNGRKTVLLACDAFFPVVDGVINVVDNYARLLSKQMNVLVLAPDFRGRVHVCDYPVLGCRSLFSKKLFYQVALPDFDVRCGRLLEKLRIDLIHCHSPFLVGHYARRLARRRKIPFISTFHTQFRQDFVKIVGDNFLANFLMKYIMKVFNRSDEVWTMCPAVGEVLRNYGFKGEVQYFRNATTMPAPEDYAAERRRGRERLGDKLVFLFVGRLVTQKNILFIAEVLGELKARGLDFTMLFVGDGCDREKLERKLMEENVFENTIFTGRITEREQLCQLYAAADLFLFPSLYDAQSLVQIEAASRHTPVAFAENSVTSFAVTHGVNGYKFPCKREPFAAGILEAVQNREQLIKVGKNAYRDLFVSWEEVVQAAAVRYQEVLARFAGAKHSEGVRAQKLKIFYEK